MTDQCPMPSITNDVQAYAQALILAITAPDEKRAKDCIEMAAAFKDRLGDKADIVRETVDTVLMQLQQMNE